MVGGYFLADAYINQSWQLSLTGIPGNLVQAAAGYVIALAAYPLLQKKMHRHPDMHHKNRLIQNGSFFSICQVTGKRMPLYA